MKKLTHWLGNPDWVQVGISSVAAGLTYLLLWAAFPPNGMPEAAYVFLLPAAVWFYQKPSYRSVALAFFIAGYFMHLAIFFWLRNVSPLALYLGVPLPSIYLMAWFLLARWAIPRCLVGNSLAKRLAVMVLLSAAWTCIEWLRCQFIYGFPWLPLSASQWQRPAILQVAPWTGAWAISFFLIFFNLAIASYVHHLLVRRKRMERGAPFSLCPDFYVAFALFAGLFALFIATRPEPGRREPLMKIGFVQPYLKHKWQPTTAKDHIVQLRESTLKAGLLNPDLVLWPEASTPYGITRDRKWVESLATEIGCDLLIGATSEREGLLYNSVALVRHEEDQGLVPAYYDKRVLVPFGEYVPFGFSWIPGIRKIVGPIGHFHAGDRPAVLPVRSDQDDFLAGPLVCYEDIFPQLSRSAVQSGADFLFVSTNNAWFGEEGSTRQHAAHSVMRAVELRRPVIRCGNHGWSGWIDEYGNVPVVPHRIDSGVNRNPLPLHLRGIDAFPVTRDPAWADQLTFYARYGDWFPYLCFALLVPLVAWLRKEPVEELAKEESTPQE